MIAKVENMNMRQENYKEDQKTKDMLENHKEKESKTMLVQLKEVMDDHRDISLSEILKGNQRVVTRIEDFNIDYVLDEETHVNIMPESTWEILGKPDVVPSLGRCWQPNQIFHYLISCLHQCFTNIDFSSQTSNER